MITRTLHQEYTVFTSPVTKIGTNYFIRLISQIIPMKINYQNHPLDNRAMHSLSTWANRETGMPLHGKHREKVQRF